MMIQNNYQLTYCTNIHPGEDWKTVRDQLKTHALAVKKTLAPDQAFGIGLRLSDQASRELAEDAVERRAFRHWLKEQHCYVFTMNGFPFGSFHGQAVKDRVHRPDWRQPERLKYSLRLFDLLVDWLPPGIDGGVSTSPLSYKPWLTTDQMVADAFERSSHHLAELCAYLHILEQETGCVLHLDIEPEPDGLLENTEEVISFFENHLLPTGAPILQRKLGIDQGKAEALIRHHIRLCYDVCHFALAYEAPGETFNQLAAAGIQIGKVQVSAALEVDWLEQDPIAIKQALTPFAESTYLHQVVGLTKQYDFVRYPDLPAALVRAGFDDCSLWRIHYHVPIFLERYQLLRSTQPTIVDVLKELHYRSVCKHLEVETYTWSVLPDNLQEGLQSSIIREMQWLQQTLDKTSPKNGTPLEKRTLVS